jgi:hypothetical protein
LIFDGTNKPDATSYVVRNVTDPSITYRFYVTAKNFNGEGAASPVALLRSCTRPSSGPGMFPAPSVEAVSSTEVSISWKGPVGDGGCRILGYSIYVDDGAGLFSEYDSANVRNKPFLSTYTISMATPPKVVGSTYRIKVGAANSIGEVFSDSVAVLLASVPSAPSPPTKRLVNSTHVEIVMQPPSSDGGDMIRDYQLQIKVDHSSETWLTVLGGGSQGNLDLVYALPID